MDTDHVIAGWQICDRFIWWPVSLKRISLFVENQGKTTDPQRRLNPRIPMFGTSEQIVSTWIEAKTARIKLLWSPTGGFKVLAPLFHLWFCGSTITLAVFGPATHHIAAMLRFDNEGNERDLDTLWDVTGKLQAEENVRLERRRGALPFPQQVEGAASHLGCKKSVAPYIPQTLGTPPWRGERLVSPLKQNLQIYRNLVWQRMHLCDDHVMTKNISICTWST